jgi:hypothetical protein
MINKQVEFLPFTENLRILIHVTRERIKFMAMKTYGVWFLKQFNRLVYFHQSINTKKIFLTQDQPMPSPTLQTIKRIIQHSTPTK